MTEHSVPQPAFFDLTPDRAIRLDLVSSVEIDSGPAGYGDAPRRAAVLRVVMENGTEHAVAHGSGSMGEIDAFKVHRDLKRVLAAHWSEPAAGHDLPPHRPRSRGYSDR